jgi:AcrR family transcriptional regulator
VPTKLAKPAARASKKKAPTRRAIGRPAASSPGVGRQALIEKTCELLRSLPPDKVTRAEVARHAKVDPSLIRYYFKERSALLVAAAEQTTQQFANWMEKRVSETDHSPESLLRTRIETQLDLNLANPFFHRLMTEELVHSKSSEAKLLLHKVTARAMNGYRSILTAGIKDGSMREVETAFLFLSVVGMCEFFLAGLPILKIAMGEDIDEAAVTARYREFVFDLVMNGLRKPGKK